MIENYSFGIMRVQGVDYSDDLKIIKGKVKPGWWRIKGHRVLTDDVRDILEAKPNILVIGKGRWGLLRVDNGLRVELEREGIKLIEENTGRAIKEFNRLLEKGADVAGGFHLSC